MIDSIPVRLAERAEVADLAVLHRPGLGARRVLDEVFEPPADATVVGAELLRPKGSALAGTEHDVHLFRRLPLNASDLLRVEAELQDVVRLRVPRKLRVDEVVQELERARR